MGHAIDENRTFRRFRVRLVNSVAHVSKGMSSSGSYATDQLNTDAVSLVCLSVRNQDLNTRIAVAYMRVNTSDQHLSVEAQRAAIEAWAQREGITVAGWHVDHGVSGRAELADRPALVAALAELRTANAGVLIVLRRDRLARDVATAIAIERAVEMCGARVRSADGVGDGDT